MYLVSHRLFVEKILHTRPGNPNISFNESFWMRSWIVIILLGDSYIPNTALAGSFSWSSHNQSYPQPDHKYAQPLVTIMASSNNSIVPSNNISGKYNDSSTPYFLQHYNKIVNIPISWPLFGDTYPSWSHAMLTALSGNDKLGFIDGKIPKHLVSQMQQYSHI